MGKARSSEGGAGLRLARAQVLSYRVTVHGLARPGRADAVLATGLQAHPSPRSAVQALRLRGVEAPEAHDTVLVHAARAALHMHRSADVPSLAAGLWIDDGRALAPAIAGPFPAQIESSGISFSRALALVAAAMQDVTTDAVPRTKGELSGAVTALVDPRLAPWCAGCAVFHVNDLLFRAATLQAGLGIDPNGERRYRPLPGWPRRETGRTGSNDRREARAALVRSFLHAFGPATPAHLASWVALTPAAARSWWQAVAPNLVPVVVDGLARWAHAQDVATLAADSSAKPHGVRLLPPYDPFLELVDREFAVPDDHQRRLVWRASAVPGVLLVDGEIAGIWRQRTARKELTITVSPFRPISAARLRAADGDAHVLAAVAGATDVDVVLA